MRQIFIIACYPLDIDGETTSFIPIIFVAMAYDVHLLYVGNHSSVSFYETLYIISESVVGLYQRSGISLRLLVKLECKLLADVGGWG